MGSIQLDTWPGFSWAAGGAVALLEAKISVWGKVCCSRSDLLLGRVGSTQKGGENIHVHQLVEHNLLVELLACVVGSCVLLSNRML